MRGNESGQGSFEYVGVLAVAGLVVVAVAAAGPGRMVRGAMERTVCVITRSACPAPEEAAPAGPAQTRPFSLLAQSEPLAGIPAPPPWEPHNYSGIDDGALYDVDTPTPADVLRWDEALTAAQLLRLDGDEHSAEHLEHYLLGSGEDLEIDANSLMSHDDQMDYEFMVSVVEDLGPEALRRQQEAPDQPVVIPFASDWVTTRVNANYSDWDYAVGDYDYAVTGQMTLEPGEEVAGVDWRVHVRDRYDPSEGIHLGLNTSVDDRQMRELLRAGMARDYTLRGTTEWYDSEVSLAEDPYG